MMQVNGPCCGVLTCLLATASVNLSVSTTSRTHDSPTTPLAVGRRRHMLEVTVATHRPIAVLLVRSFDRSAPPEVAPSDYADFFINHKESLNR